MKTVRRIPWIALAAALLSGPGCVPSESSPEGLPTASHRLRIVTTTGMVADLVRRVGVEHVDVVQLMGEGVDPHLYKPSPGDIRQLIAADVIFYSGLHLEGKLADVFERLARRKTTVAVTRDLPRDRLLLVEQEHVDPHVWFDVALWSEGIAAVRSTLAKADPTHEADYRANADRLQHELQALDRECRERLASIPKERRVLLTAHDAFGYFGRAYDVEVRSIQGVSTESEAGVREINELVDFIVQRRIRAVFIESTVSDRNIQALVEGCAARGAPIRIGGELFSDAPGRTGTPEGTYVGMIRHNVQTIVQALR